MSPDHHHINNISNKAVEDWKHRNSVMFLECAVSLCLTHMSVARVIDVLQRQVQFLKDYD